MFDVQEAVDLGAFLYQALYEDQQALTRLLGEAAAYGNEDEVAIHSHEAAYALQDAVKWLRDYRKGTATNEAWNAASDAVNDVRWKLDHALILAHRRAKLRDDDTYLVAMAINDAMTWEVWFNDWEERRGVDVILRDWLKQP